MPSEYDPILKADLSHDDLEWLCLEAGLRASRVRSIVWRIFLKCLPLSKLEWKAVALRTRTRYIQLSGLHITDPHDDVFSQDPQKNNPLTQTDENPWQKFFADHDLRDIISKDVERTFPEIEFFQQAHIRRMMSNILLVYAKENSFISYKQGMHEILAPLLFVLFCDQQAFLHSLEEHKLSECSPEDLEYLKVLYDPQYLEHDAFAMFSELMLEVSKWYEDGDHSSQPTYERHRNASGPFARIQDSPATSNLMIELSAIGDRLYSVDPGLASHLSGLDIPPQLYGIRWLRLLFGREFPIHDLLYLWDVIICDRPIPRIVECVFVCMLVQIRDLLVNADYGGCLQYIMRYPPVVDISQFVQLARHFRNPKKVPRPRCLGLSNFANLTVAGKSHPNSQRGFNDEVVGYEEPPSGFRPKSQSMLAKVKDTILEKPTDRPSSSHSHPHSHSHSHHVTPRKGKPSVAARPSPSKRSPAWEKELLVMENQVACLQSRLNEKDIVCSDVAHAIDKCARDLSTANSEDSRRTIIDKLRSLSSRLTADFVPQIMSASSAEHIELAREVRASVQPRSIRKDNEMLELRNNHLFR